MVVDALPSRPAPLALQTRPARRAAAAAAVLLVEAAKGKAAPVVEAAIPPPQAAVAVLRALAPAHHPDEATEDAEAVIHARLHAELCVAHEAHATGEATRKVVVAVRPERQREEA